MAKKDAGKRTKVQGTKSKKSIPTNIANLRTTFQKQANDIAADVYTEQIKKDLPLPSLYMPPLPSIPETSIIKESIMLECFAAVSMATGFVCLGISLGLAIYR